MSKARPDRALWPPELLARWEVKDAEAVMPDLAATLALPDTVARHLGEVYGPLAERLAQHILEQPRPLVLGINGAQGTGKSTAAEVLAALLERRGLRVCRLSIDDLYLTRAEREQLAQQIHPLLATRGVPGTHEVALGMHLLDALLSAGEDTPVTVPRFDKANDDRFAAGDIWRGRPHLIVFEGWCVGARPQPEEALREPVNELERQEDADGHWRAFVNRQLTVYQPLFQRLDFLLLLRAPSFEQVYQWRAEQEAVLAQRLAREGRAASRVMDAAQLRRFIGHYERLTRWMLMEMPTRADLVLSLNAAHRVASISPGPGGRL